MEKWVLAERGKDGALRRGGVGAAPLAGAHCHSHPPGSWVSVRTLLRPRGRSKLRRDFRAYGISLLLGEGTLDGSDPPVKMVA